MPTLSATPGEHDQLGEDGQGADQQQWVERQSRHDPGAFGPAEDDEPPLDLHDLAVPEADVDRLASLERNHPGREVVERLRPVLAVDPQGRPVDGVGIGDAVAVETLSRAVPDAFDNRAGGLQSTGDAVAGPVDREPFVSPGAEDGAERQEQRQPDPQRDEAGPDRGLRQLRHRRSFGARQQ
jgi:hypothetical protein